MKIKELKDRWMVSIKDSEIQRNLIWKEEFKTKLIDSIFNNEPIGVITLFQETGLPYKEIIDGKQRMYALESFWKGNLSYRDKFFTQNNFTQEEMEHFWNYEILVQEASGDFAQKVNLFNKINTCVVPLNKYELLRAKYYGAFLSGLTDFINNDKNAKNILKEKIRGENELLVLKLIKGDKTDDEFLQLYKDEDFTKFLKLPRQVFQFINDVFVKKGNLNILLDLAQTYALNKTELFANRVVIAQDIDKLLKAHHIEGWNKISAYERILDRYAIDKDKRRWFSKEVRETLWNNEMWINHKVECKLCLQNLDPQDAIEVDHIIPWSKGGTTDIKNAQLVHRYCNVMKSNK